MDVLLTQKTTFFKSIFLKNSNRIVFQMSLKYVSNGPIDNKLALFG